MNLNAKHFTKIHMQQLYIKMLLAFIFIGNLTYGHRITRTTTCRDTEKSIRENAVSQSGQKMEPAVKPPNKE